MSPRRRIAAAPVLVGLAATGAALAAAASVLRAARGVPSAIGASARARAAAARSSGVADDPGRYHDRTFRNRLPTTTLLPGSTGALLAAAAHRGSSGHPAGDVPLVRPSFPAAADLAVTWFGHASVLVEVDGVRILADPVWGERVSPSATVGPRRLHPVPLPLADLPAVDAVVVSHDHYDHLDAPTVRELVRTQTAPFLVPLGVGAHLRRWGVPDDRIVELDWDGSTAVGPVTVTCTEARHFSGRGLRRNGTLWSSWAFAGPRHRVYFGGDTGYTPAFAEIGARLGPFDLTLLPIGAYGDHWPDIHVDPEQAWRMHGDLGGRVLVPIHWATFDLAFHGWAEPVIRLLAAAHGRNGTDSRIVVPRPGARLDLSGRPVDRPAAADAWWLPLAVGGAAVAAPAAPQSPGGSPSRPAGAGPRPVGPDGRD
ncbi:MBL fold metallo-hydrolase [Nakamurella endophytica]|uniref:Metallo-beta-lactamase domain-containing protein n=1 Tax=Nakamurella endophytica TaxID=1748367 RepID=A0A917SV84_9ACTN|nr:MBL fold metallo-hydrolase [Nakamurella endophytica]GGM00489.1 hypothetical protein GCM10011594_20730 [Nakamurella endophytica]